MESKCSMHARRDDLHKMHHVGSDTGSSQQEPRMDLPLVLPEVNLNHGTHFKPPFPHSGALTSSITSEESSLVAEQAWDLESDRPVFTAWPFLLRAV